MKNLTKTISALLPVFFIALLMSSCIKDYAESRPDNSGDGEQTVTFAMRVPSNDSPATRALGSAQEDEVDEVHVLVLNTTSGNVYKHEVATPSGVQTGNKRVFEVTLPVGEYHITVIANAAALITSKYPGGIPNGTTMAAVKENLILARQEALATEGNREADKWNTTVNSSKGYFIPMWGRLTSVTISNAPAADQNIGTVNMYRMVAKIDVRVPREESDGTAIPTGDFEFTAVRFYNYNTKGYVIPESTNGNWENVGGGKASNPSAVAAANNFVSGDKKYQEYTAIDNSYTVPTGDIINEGGSESALIGEIYTFEIGDGSDYTTRPCVIIGGTYKGSTSWYRVDMVSSSTGAHLDLLRNHRYVVWVKSIKGPGYSTPEEAYKSKPINLEATVIPWDENEYLEGVWNGNHYIKFSTLDSHFSQFGEPAEHTVTIKTNCADLKLGDFVNVYKVDGDGTWTAVEAAEGTWTNGRFTVRSAKTATSGDESVYTLTISALATSTGDTKRESQFRIKALNLNATATISQDKHIEFLLESNDLTTLREIDGNPQRVEINLSSTHDFKVDFKDNAMFSGVYTVAAGGTPIDDDETIPADTKKIWVEVDEHASVFARVGEVFIEHVASVNSTAGALIYKVLQVTPTISALLSTNGREGEIPKAGGSVTINVTSNLSGWVPVLKIKQGSLSFENYTGDLATYFNPTQGAQNKSVTFTLPELVGDDDVIYEIHFRDVNDMVATDNPIEITHKAKVLGSGGGGMAPQEGMPAPEGILAVNNLGLLNLDGQTKIGTDGITKNFIVYFKWGSTIALAGGANGDVFNKDKVAWVPDEYDYQTLMDNIDTRTANDAWALINYAGSDLNTDKYPDSFPTGTPEELAAGLGDPCMFAVKGGAVGGYRMPTDMGDKNDYSAWTTASDLPGRYYKKDSPEEQFYPASGYRHSTSGAVLSSGKLGYSWTAMLGLAGTNSLSLSFSSSGSVLLPSYDNRTQGHPVRCVKTTP